MDYKKKYLMYKQKYLNLKGGSSFHSQTESINKINLTSKCSILSYPNIIIDYFNSMCTVIDDIIEFRPDVSVQVIGSGGYGLILLITPPIDSEIPKFTLKLIYTRSGSMCEQAKLEFYKILKVKNAYNKLLSIVDPELNYLLQFINPLTPYGYYECNIKYNYTIYKCGLLTSYSEGFNVQRHIINYLQPSITMEEKNYIERHYNNILILPSADYELIKLWPANIDLKINNTNPIRYGTLKKEKFIEFGLINDALFLDNYSKIMGIIQAIFLWGAKLTMSDVEILIGPNKDLYYYNIIDYGMTGDINISDMNIDYISDIITDISTPFFTKSVFPYSSDTDEFNKFYTYFVKVSKLYNPSLDDDFFDELKTKIILNL